MFNNFTLHQHNLVCVSTLFFIEKETTGESLVYPEPNNQTTVKQLCLKAIKMLVFPSVCWFKTARLLVKILIRTLRLCRNGGLAQITQMLTNIHIMPEIFSFSQLSKQRELTFLKVVIDTVSFLPSDIFSSGSQRKRKN